MIPILDALMPVVSKLLDFIPDPQKKAEAQLKLTQELDKHQEEILKALAAIDQSQAAINTEEAKSSNLFISGWRPSIGWICGLAFAWSYVLQPITVFVLNAAGHPLKDLPVLNIGEMMPVLLGMLGLGGLRTWEKQVGVNDKH